MADEETFASIYCQSRAVTCANLGRPGTGTVRQIDRLANALSRGCRPREVKLFILAMTSSIFPGNDLSDLWETANRARLTASAAGSAERESEGADRGGGGRGWAVDRALSDSWVGLVLSYRVQITRVSNLARVAKLYWGPLLLSRVVPGFDRERLQESLRLLEQEIARLETLGAEAGFEYQVYLIHPVQDLINGTHGSTYDRLSSVAVPNLVSTAHLFLEAPADFYFPFHGHLNGRGARRVAEFLLEADGGSSP